MEVSFYHKEQGILQMVLCGITLIFAMRMNKPFNTALHDIGCQGKVLLFMLALLIGFAGAYLKIAHLKRKEGPKKGTILCFSAGKHD